MTVAEKLTPEAIESLYSFAFGFYQNGKYEEAIRFFRFLTVADATTKKHWMGLGASYQMQQQFEKALQSYGFAGLLDPQDPQAPFHAAECLISLAELTRAAEALEAAEQLVNKNLKNYEWLAARIQLMRNKTHDSKNRK